MKKTLLILIAAIVLTGCAVGNKHVYNDIEVITDAKSGKTVSVATVDQREYVVSGQSKPEFVGMQRGGFGNPFDVLTASGRPLSSEFTAAVRNALERNGVKVFSLDTKPSNATQPAMAELVVAPGGAEIINDGAASQRAVDIVGAEGRIAFHHQRQHPGHVRGGHRGALVELVAGAARARGFIDQGAEHAIGPHRTLLAAGGGHIDAGAVV